MSEFHCQQHLSEYFFSDHSADVDIQRHVQLMHNRQCKHHFQSVTSLLLFKSRVKSILFARYLSFPAALFDIRASNSNLKILSFIAHCHFFGAAQNRSQVMIGSPMILKRIKNLIRLQPKTCLIFFPLFLIVIS